MIGFFTNLNPTGSGLWYLSKGVFSVVPFIGWFYSLPAMFWKHSCDLSTCRCEQILWGHQNFSASEGRAWRQKITLCPVPADFALLPKALKERWHGFVVLIYIPVPWLLVRSVVTQKRRILLSFCEQYELCSLFTVCVTYVSAKFRGAAPHVLQRSHVTWNKKFHNFVTFVVRLWGNLLLRQTHCIHSDGRECSKLNGKCLFWM